MNSPSESLENIAQIPFSVSGWIFQIRRQYFKGTESGPCVPGGLFSISFHAEELDPDISL